MHAFMYIIFYNKFIFDININSQVGKVTKATCTCANTKRGNQTGLEEKYHRK